MKRKGIVYIKQGEDFQTKQPKYCYDGTTLDKINVTKMLGGKDNIKKRRLYTHHGGGGYYTLYEIIDIATAKEAILANNCDYKIMTAFDCHGNRELVETSIKEI